MGGCDQCTVRINADLVASTRHCERVVDQGTEVAVMFASSPGSDGRSRLPQFSRMHATPFSRRAAIVAILAVVLNLAPTAQEPSLKAVITRVGAYIQNFESRMATIVAEEDYRQTVERLPALLFSQPDRQTRMLRSDYALVRAAGRGEFVGFRDTFEVDGQPVRDHDDRLQELVTSGAFADAARIANESARFNLAAELVARNINVPTFALQLLQPDNRDRFSFRKAGTETIAGTRTWRIEYSERGSPTLVKTADHHDQRSNGSIWVDAETGTVWRTMIFWDRSPTRTLGQITVTYGRAPGIDILVPVTMSERYEPPGITIEGEATYSKFRQFRTDARVVPGKRAK
jgi:hypothetical protein